MFIKVVQTLDVSDSYAYRQTQQINKEQKALGDITISGRVNCKFFVTLLCSSSLPSHRISTDCLL